MLQVASSLHQPNTSLLSSFRMLKKRGQISKIMVKPTEVKGLKTNMTRCLMMLVEQSCFSRTPEPVGSET